jgi:hypothetical protein
LALIIINLLSNQKPCSLMWYTVCHSKSGSCSIFFLFSVACPATRTTGTNCSSTWRRRPRASDTGTRLCPMRPAWSEVTIQRHCHQRQGPERKDGHHLQRRDQGLPAASGPRRARKCHRHWTSIPLMVQYYYQVLPTSHKIFEWDVWVTFF